MSLADSLIAGVNSGRPTQHLVKMVNPARRVVDHLGDDNQRLHGIGDALANANPDARVCWRARCAKDFPKAARVSICRFSSFIPVMQLDCVAFGER